MDASFHFLPIIVMAGDARIVRGFLRRRGENKRKEGKKNREDKNGVQEACPKNWPVVIRDIFSHVSVMLPRFIGDFTTNLKKCFSIRTDK
jgi:hypothetical protein